MSEKGACPWESQLVEVKSRHGWSTKVYAPLLCHRWKLFARKPKVALRALYQLPPNTIRAILEHLYANTPVSRMNLPAFKACKIINKIPFESTYHQDILDLLHNKATTDFRIIPSDSKEPLCVHRFILYARSNFFRKLFTTQKDVDSFQEEKMGKDALDIFSEYLYTGQLEFKNPVAAIELIGSGKYYEFRDPNEIDFLVMNSLQSSLNEENAPHVKAKAIQLGLENVTALVENTKFSSSRVKSIN
ncbi:BTB/POZ domain containing protein [Histomonas meleagridis]|uniref:BTB/POZ domain containing protein n=1 Tax=Histomonas meleagridis TaxID=135588 RepID=UPI0035593E91|nr:BTB/POZ domain containing protein [Histomonas meleagridis]KAH0801568.1 BTB/POZ domain containing protein [Histomonas meleagridis]